MRVSPDLQKTEAVITLAAASGLGTVNPWIDTVSRTIASIADILPPQTNRGVALQEAAALPAATRRGVFAARSRTLRAPVHLHGVPPGFTATTREALSPDLRLLGLPDGVLCDLGDMPLVLNAEATVLVSDFSSRYARLLHYYDIDIRRLAADAIRVPGPLLLIADDVRPVNFSHWVLDWLPRIVCLAGVVPRNETFIAVPRLPDKPFVRETLAAFGFADEHIIEVARTQAVRSRLLLVPDDLPNPPHPGHKGAPWLTAFLREQLAGDALEPLPRRKIYVARGEHEGRHIADDPALAAALAELGYERIVLDRLPFAQQVEAFASASHIIAAHGAGLALLAFTRADARVLEIFPESYGTAAYYVIAASRGLDYASYVAPAIPRERAQLDNIALDLPAFLATIRARFDQDSADAVR
jgi:capsular polysaccharide biosynthesis protein